MKIEICTTPIRPVPTVYPPFGSLAVIQALRRAGYDPGFYDIDGLRPNSEEVVDHFRASAPDIVGISAVVSTAYGYTKRFCKALREALPGVKIVVGGNLAASGELLHRLCNVDVCVIGEGDLVIVNLVKYFEQNPGKLNHDGLRDIRGITFLDADNEMVFTGYETAVPAEELVDPDYTILEQYSDISNYIVDPFRRQDFASSPRSQESHRAGKKMGTVITTKGCVARCTFCHRWDRGFRQIPPQKVIAQIKYLMDRYNVGFVEFSDENFGSNRKATEELLRLLKPLDIIWEVGGMRARTVDPELLQQMRDAGCIAAYFGFETGSPDILEVMEKKVDLEDNLNAARWTHEAGLYTCYQIVLGMPGESPRTVSETIDMFKKVTEFLPRPPIEFMSINYLQALPGTPVYEYARLKGLIGPTLEDEEAYLLSISDKDAYDPFTFINFTDYPYLTVQGWKLKLLLDIQAHYARVRNWAPDSLSRPRSQANNVNQGGYFNIQTEFVSNTLLLRCAYPFRSALIWVRNLVRNFRQNSLHVAAGILWEAVSSPVVKRGRRQFEYRSLRRIVKDLTPAASTRSEESAAPLRQGR